MSRPVTKFRNKSTEMVFRHIVEDDRLLDEVTEEMATVGSLAAAVSLLRNTMLLRFPRPVLEGNGI